MPELIGLVTQGEPVIGGHDLTVLIDGGEDDEICAGALCGGQRDFERPEAARERYLDVVGYLLVAKQQDRMLLERSAYFAVCVIVGSDVGKRDAPQLGGKARTQRDGLHRR